MLLPSSRTGAIEAHRLMTNKAEPVPLAVAMGASGGVIATLSVAGALFHVFFPMPECKSNEGERAAARR